MPRPRKDATPVVENTQEDVVVEQEAVVEPVKEFSKVNVKRLKELLWKANLETLQEAVADIDGDELTMRAVQGVLTAPNSGIAAQFVQQIIQRNNG